MKNNNRNDKLGLGLMIGVIVGAVAGIFLNPKTGKENRDMVGDKMQELKEAFEKGDLDERVHEMFGEVTNQTKELYIQSTEDLTNRLMSLKDAVEDIDKDKYMDVVMSVITGLKEDQTIPEKDIENVKKYLQKDYQRLVDYNKEKKTKAPAKKTQKKLVASKK